MTIPRTDEADPYGITYRQDSRSDSQADERLLSSAECERIEQSIQRYAGGEHIHVRITTWWQGELRWARNRVWLAGDRRDIQVAITGIGGTAFTNQADDVSLQAAVRAIGYVRTWEPDRIIPELTVGPPRFDTPSPIIWSDATYRVTAAERGKLAQRLTERADAEHLLSAGYLQLRAGEVYVSASSVSDARYDRYTEAQCSMTVRHPEGTGSGWAGQSGFDWSVIDSGLLATHALERCTASLNPVRIEPGRYTAILEPQAVCDMMNALMIGRNFSRIIHERFSQGPFLLGNDKVFGIMRTKLGLQVADARISIWHDPADPELGVLPEAGLEPITWIDRGVLTAMNHGPESGNMEGYRTMYALPDLNDNETELWRPAFRMSGGRTTLDEMIATTTRGLLVTRFSNLDLLDRDSVLLTGTTRDGLWLIEQGKISKAVNNFRITESPLFILNQIEQLGVPVPVFRPGRSPYDGSLTPAIVPPLKINDFSFTATVDAI